MLTRLAITGFQSHANTVLNLGRFTVIVGPSSSGKSSVARALRVLVSNSSGTPYVRHGARVARVSASFSVWDGDPSDAHTEIVVERGPGLSRYELVIPGEDAIEFTKCGRSVPQAIQDSHDLDSDELWLAGQFDRPFLLDETGSAIARTLGDLTGVSMIFSAVRECNRRASDAKSKHTYRSDSLVRVLESLQSFADLPQKLSACSAAESALVHVRALAQRRDRLGALLGEVADASVRREVASAQLCVIPSVSLLVTLESRRSRLLEMVRTVEVAASRRAAIRLVRVPDLTQLRSVTERRTRLRTALTEVIQSELSRRQAVEAAATQALAAEGARDQLREVLTQAGTCPVCGADAEHAQLDRITGVSL